MSTHRSHSDRLEDLRRRNAEAEAGGGAERRERQHQEGKLSARERIELLLDEGTFEELDKFVRHHCQDFGMEEQRPLGDGFITGYGRIDGRLVYAFAQDFTIFGGSLSQANASKITKIMDLAVRSGAPIYAAEEVISESAIEFEHDVEESEDVVEKFKEFLDEVSPEDFAAGDS